MLSKKEKKNDSRYFLSCTFLTLFFDKSHFYESFNNEVFFYKDARILFIGLPLILCIIGSKPIPFSFSFRQELTSADLTAINYVVSLDLFPHFVGGGGGQQCS